METKMDKKRRRKGGKETRKRKKKSPKRCPAKRTPQCSVLHEWHEKHVQYHNVVDNKLLKQVNEKPCRYSNVGVWSCLASAPRPLIREIGFRAVA